MKNGMISYDSCRCNNNHKIPQSYVGECKWMKTMRKPVGRP